ncbi:alpha/beta fold hydrolase, partial [Mycobacterium pseudoshottsii]
SNQLDRSPDSPCLHSGPNSAAPKIINPAHKPANQQRRSPGSEGVQDFLDKVPHAEFVELSNAGHTAAGDDNDAFTEVVVDFVKRRAATG